MKSKLVIALITSLWIVITIYFQSFYMAMSFLTAVFSVYWYHRSLPDLGDPNDPTQEPPTWWFWTYVLPVVLSVMATFAFLAFAINTTFGLMVMSFQAGVALTCLAVISGRQ